MDIDIHDLVGRYERSRNILTSDTKILDQNRELILKFDQWTASKGVKLPKRIKYIYQLRTLSKWFNKSFREVTNEEVLTLIANLNDGIVKNKYDKRYSSETINDFKAIIKTFFSTFLESPQIVKGVKRKKAFKELQPGDIWTEEELYTLVESGQTLQEKAFLSVLAETGCRIGEIGSLKIKNIIPRETPESKEIGIWVNGKTGSRPCLLIWSVPYLENWLREHPFRTNPDSSIWIIMNGQLRPMTYLVMRSIVKRAHQLSGINKKLWPHLIRHSICTMLIRKGYHPTKLLKRMGWSPASSMIARYQHLVPQDVFDEDRRINGLVKVETVKQLYQCSKCNTPVPTYGLCASCRKIKEEMDLAEVRKIEVMRIQEEQEQRMQEKMKQLVIDTIQPLLQAGSMYMPQLQQQFGTGYLDPNKKLNVKRDGWVVWEQI